MIKRIGFWAIVLLFAACARIVTPSGGAVDRIPPKEMNAIPKQNSLNFKDRGFVVEFDEYIVLDNVNQKLLVSPPLKVKPEISAKLKKLYVKGLDSLAENTTYIFDFADAITDFNEGNRLKNFKYAFSTGSQIDSLFYEGRVVEGFSLKNVADKLVLLYADTVLANLYDKDCDYITRTDSMGRFSFSNLAVGTYRLLILDDKNQNKRYDLPSEGVGFSRYAVMPYAKDSTDTVSRKDNLFFYEDATDSVQSVTDARFSAKGVFTVAFARPLSDEVVFDFVKPKSEQEIKYEMSRKRDTVSFFACKGVCFDTVELHVADGDFKDEISKTVVANRKKRDDDSCFRFRSLQKDTVHYFDRKFLAVGLPLDSERIPARFVSGNDTLETSLALCEGLTKYCLSEDLERGRQYRLIVDSGTAKDFIGRANDFFETAFYLTQVADYGRLILNFEDSAFIDVPHIFYLCDMKAEVLKQINVPKGKGSVVFDCIEQGMYKVKVVIDENANGQWDGASFKEAQPVERILMLDKPVSIRKSWDTEENWTIFR